MIRRFAKSWGYALRYAKHEQSIALLLGISQSALSHQLRQLRDRRVVVRGKRGRVDAEQTQACRYLSIVVLAGIGLNALFGREAWAGEHDHA